MGLALAPAPLGLTLPLFPPGLVLPLFPGRSRPVEARWPVPRTSTAASWARTGTASTWPSTPAPAANSRR